MPDFLRWGIWCFNDVCGSGDNRGNGRGKQCKDALNVCSQSFAGCETIQAHTAPHPTENRVVYGALAVMVEDVTLINTQLRNVTAGSGGNAYCKPTERRIVSGDPPQFEAAHCRPRLTMEGKRDILHLYKTVDRE